MQGLTKKLLVAFLTVFLGVSVISCNNNETTEGTPNESKIPTLSNGDEVYLSTADYDLTYGELYQEVKLNDGANKLIDYIDADLLSSYYSGVTTAQIEEKEKQLKYGTADPDELAEYTAEQLADSEQEFIQSMTLLGLEGTEEYNDYMTLLCARDAYVLEQMTSSANAEESWYIDAEQVALWYTQNQRPDLYSIKIRFMSELEANLIMRELNLVSKDGVLRLYTGTLPIEQVPSSQIDDTNSRLLTDAELLEKFLEIYNIVYSGYRDAIPTDSSLTALKAIEELELDYDEVATANGNLVSYIYDSLGNYNDYVNNGSEDIYYTNEPIAEYNSSSDTATYLILNLEKEELVDLSDFDGDEADLVAQIGQTLYDEIEQEIIESNLKDSTFVDSILQELRVDNDLVIYDYYLASDYLLADSDFVLSEEGHETLVATYSDKEITADQLFAHCLDLNVAMYTTSALQIKEVVAAHFEDVYCEAGETCEYDISKNTSEKMEEHRTAIQSLKSDFEESYYSSVYDWEQYLYLAYGAISENDMLYRYYVKSNLLSLYIYDELISDNYDDLNRLNDMFQPYYDNYFSLNVEHLLIYVDRDEDGDPDNYSEFYNDLSDSIAYDALLSDFETEIRTYLDSDENTMSTLVEDYSRASRSDLTWGSFKDYGFMLMNESLGELTYATVVGLYEQEFEDGLIALYNTYNTPELENESYIYDDNLIETRYGVHIIKASKGSGFDKPSAKFTMTYTDGEADYLMGLVNASSELSFDQLKVYADYSFADLASEITDIEEVYDLTAPEIPENVLEAMEAYFAPVYEASFVVGYINNTIISKLSTFTYTPNSTYLTVTQSELLADAQITADVIMYQVYQDYDHREED